MFYQLSIVEHDDIDNNSESQSLIPKLSSGFNSYYIDKLKHIKEALEDMKDKEKDSKFYKIVSPGSVNKSSLLYKEYGLGTKQINYILYEIFKTFKITGTISTNDKQTEKALNDISKLINIKLNNSNFNIYLNNKKINFYKNFYSQETDYLPILKEEINNIDKLKSGGIFITRIYNIFLQNTENIIINLINKFDKVYIFKPLTVDNYKVDKYLICIDKKTKPNTLNGSIANLNQINSELIINQTRAINEVINYINGKNYRGAEYDKYAERQLSEQKKIIKDLK